MFEDSLLESGGKYKKQRNPWATVLSFTIEVAGIGLLVLIPMIYTEALPVGTLTSYIGVTAPTRQAEQPAEASHPAQPHQEVASNYNDGKLVQPGKIPTKTILVDDPKDGGGGPVGLSRTECPGCIPDGAKSDPFTDKFLRSTAQPVLAKPTVGREIVQSQVMEGLLIRKVMPVYPELAKRARIQGSVMLTATISRDGSIQNLIVNSGHPMLTRAAMDAVKQWRYRPYLLNREPVDVETTVTVTFTLN